MPTASKKSQPMKKAKIPSKNLSPVVGIVIDRVAGKEKIQQANKIKDTKDSRIAQLERDLLSAREDMRSVTENQEAANEELRSANKELVTVNQELHDSNELYNQARLYAEAIVATIHEPLLVLNKDFRIKSANPAFYKTFQITEEETLGKVLFELQNI